MSPARPSVPLNQDHGDYIQWSRFEAWENTPKTRHCVSREIDHEIDRDRFWSRQLPQIGFVARSALTRQYQRFSCLKRLCGIGRQRGEHSRTAAVSLMWKLACEISHCRLFAIGRQSGRTSAPRLPHVRRPSADYAFQGRPARAREYLSPVLMLKMLTLICLSSCYALEGA
jgi:hypothetical protein